MPPLASFRKGWENENLARFLLYKFSFIANPSTVSDDFGIDYFCTLFQRKLVGEREYLIPRNSFAIQIKSDKTRLDFSKKVDYLNQLELPFFIGIVERNEMKLTIYSGEYIPLLFSLKSPPKYLKINFRERKTVNSSNYYQEKGEKIILTFPKTIEINATIKRDELIRKIDDLFSVITIIQDNISSKRNGEYIFRLIQHNLAKAYILAGSGSNRYFRDNFMNRLAEVYYNLAWIYRNRPNEFDNQEYSLYKKLYEDLEKNFSPIPDVVKFAFVEMEKVIKGII
jgi:hypothetical protein